MYVDVLLYPFTIRVYIDILLYPCDVRIYYILQFERQFSEVENVALLQYSF